MDIYFNKIIRVKPLVLRVLRENNSSRDDDNLLLIQVWELQSPNINNYQTFKELLIGGTLSTPSTIVRSRRKLQENNIELRGELYEERKKQEIIMRNQLKLFF